MTCGFANRGSPCSRATWSFSSRFSGGRVFEFLESPGRCVPTSSLDFPFSPVAELIGGRNQA